MPLNSHWLFYRLLRHIAIDMFQGIQDPTRKQQQKNQNPATNTGSRGGMGEFLCFTRERNVSSTKRKVFIKVLPWNKHSHCSFALSKGTNCSLPSCDCKAIGAIKCQEPTFRTGLLGRTEAKRHTHRKDKGWTHVSQFFTPHSVSLILPRGLTDLAISHWLSSVGQPLG